MNHRVIGVIETVSTITRRYIIYIYNVINNVWHHMFHYQKVDSSVYIRISGHQSSDDGK